MVQVKTSDLSGAALDWAVAKCEGVQIVFFEKFHWVELPRDDRDLELGEGGATHEAYRPSSSWAQGGPIIDQLTRRGFRIHGRKCRYTADETSVNVDVNGHYAMSGPTILIAAMRCFVASKLGDVVDVPQELL